MAPALVNRPKRQRQIRTIGTAVLRSSILISALFALFAIFKEPFDALRTVRPLKAKLTVAAPADSASATASGVSISPSADSPTQALTPSDGAIQHATQNTTSPSSLPATPASPPSQAPSQKGCLPTEWTGHAGHFNLTREAVACVADEHGVVLVTWANWHYYDFVSNWVYHLREAKVRNFLVGAMDDKLLEALAADGISTFSMASGLTTDDFGWGSKTFHKMGREKIGLIVTFTQMGFSILVSDVDTVWIDNPLPYMDNYPQADCLTSSDHLADTVQDGFLELYPEAGSAANIGIMLFRPNASDFAKAWLEVILADETVWDQNAFNDLMRLGQVLEPRRPDRLFLGWKGRIKFGILPVSRFCSGHTYFVQHMPQRVNTLPYVAHATFQFGGTPGKRNRFREALLWNDPPEYFDGRFVAYTPDVPPQMLSAAVPPNNREHKQSMKEAEPQFALIHHQFAQIRSAWAIAQTFNRTLVLPEIWTGNDRYWAALEAGRIPGSKTILPFSAPVDHFLDMESMLRELPEEQYGPMLPHGAYRESSFLRNKRLPPPVRDSQLHIAICRGNQTGVTCADGSTAAVEAGGKVWLAPELSDAQLRIALQPFMDRRILNFDSMLGAFGGFLGEDGKVDRRFGDSLIGRRFQRRLVEYAGMFCCLHEMPVGHVFYDFFFDVPHIDRFKRQWVDPTWKLMMGP